MKPSDALLPGHALNRLSSWTGPAALAAVIAAGAVTLRGFIFGDAAPGRLLLDVLLCTLVAYAVTHGQGLQGRATLTIFLAALAVRLVAVLVLDEWTARVGGAFVVSPDAAGYDHWARRLLDSWTAGGWLDLRRPDMTGRWEVGFEHVLAAAYGIFGEGSLLGRTLGGVFGALAAMFFWLASLELVPERVAAWAGVAYALWPTSAAWCSWSVLRDSLVWALLYAGIWCALRVIRGHRSYIFSLAFAAAFLLLRLVRAYAALLLMAGLGLAFALALIQKRRGIAGTVLLLATALAGAEVVIALIGFPSAFRAAVSVVRPEAVLHRWSDFEGPPAGNVGEPSEPGEADVSLVPAELGVKQGSGRFLGVSLAANALRFVFGPPAWAPTGADDARSMDWLLPAMWFWYAILPLSAAGFVFGVIRHPAFRPIAIIALVVGLLLTLAGEGAFYRQREMLVPIVVLAGAIGLESALHRPRAFAAAVLGWAILLGAGIAYSFHLSRTRMSSAAPVTPGSH